MTMAFNFVPKSAEEIIKTKKSNADVVAQIYEYVNSKYGTHISLDPKGSTFGIVNIPRFVESLDSMVTIKAELSRKKVDISKVKLLFGDGSGIKRALGYVVEAVLIIAMTARFINKNQPIGKADIDAVITAFKRARNKGTKQSVLKQIKRKSLNRDPSIVDDVHGEISLSEVDYELLMNPKNKTKLSPFYNSAMVFVNSALVSEHAIRFYENNQENVIKIDALGIVGQGIEKADIKVFAAIKGEPLVPIDLTISVKVNNTPQFSQVSGSEFRKQQELWKGLLGVDITPIEEKYHTLIAKGKVNDAICLAYKTAADMFNQPRHNKISTLLEGVAHHMSMGETKLITVNMTRSGASVYRISKLAENLKDDDVPLSAKVIEYPDYYLPGSQPRLEIMRGKTTLLKVRKASTPQNGTRYARNYIEGVGIFDLMHEETLKHG
jgi:hypothetical protein